MTTSIPGPSGLGRYLFAQSAYFASAGLSSVVYPWLLTHELHETEALVGVAQALSTIPTMLLVLVGGAAADGRDLRRYVAQLQLIAAIVPIALGMVVAMHALNFPALIVYGLMWGTLAAFVMPGRDALLFYVTPENFGLTRTIALATGATFTGQVLGILLGAGASSFGAVPLLSVQAGLLAAAAIATAGVKLARPQPAHTPHFPSVKIISGQIVEGMRIVWASERLRTVTLLIVLGSPLFNGVFLVGLPLINRAYYGNDSATLAGLSLAFMVAVTVTSLIVARLKPIEAQGRVFMIAYVCNTIALFLMHFEMPFPALCALIFIWGLGAGIGVSMSRSMIQAAAPSAYRARVLSVFQFGQVSGGPPGALLIGLLAENFGILNAMLAPPALAAVLWVIFRTRTSLWHFRRDEAALHAQT